MKGRYNIFAKQSGMTLIEVLVTIAILSFVLGAALTLYSTTFRNIRTHDSFLNILHDADLIMSYIGDDIRHANHFLNDYPTDESQIVVAAMSTGKGAFNKSEETVIVYSLETKRPKRLIRSVHIGEKTTSLELSKLIQEIKILPTTDKLFKVTLTLKDEVAGKVNSLHASSAFALKY
jgi:prepilin-type N-terminal cleavage/methylation domain-containing protein